jgi:protoporphyrin/coproporphyrin ferrochelatase
MAYGTPGSLDEVAAYYTHIRRGRAPEPALVEELQDRYRSLGGTSPLRRITAAQTSRLAAALGAGVIVAQGNKHAAPFIEDAVAEVVAAGAVSVTGVVLAPHYSRGSVGEYAARLAGAAAGHGLPARTVEQWADLPEWIGFEAAAVRDGVAGLPARSKVLFTAHSLPERVLAEDPYPEQLQMSAAAIADAAGLAPQTDWSLAWQSAGRTAEPWRGPDILEVIDDLARTGQADGVLVCPQGFVADHLEVLHDLDQVAARRAAEVGLAFARTRSLNDDEPVLRALARRVAALVPA